MSETPATSAAASAAGAAALAPGRPRSLSPGLSFLALAVALSLLQLVLSAPEIGPPFGFAAVVIVIASLIVFERGVRLSAQRWRRAARWLGVAGLVLMHAKPIAEGAVGFIPEGSSPFHALFGVGIWWSVGSLLLAAACIAARTTLTRAYLFLVPLIVVLIVVALHRGAPWGDRFFLGAGPAKVALTLVAEGAAFALIFVATEWMSRRRPARA